MNVIKTSALLLLCVVHIPLHTFDENMMHQIQILQNDIVGLQNQALEKNINADHFFQTMQLLQNELNALQSQANNLKTSDAPKTKRSKNSDKVSDAEVQKAHYGSSIGSEKHSAPNAKTQSLENGKDDFNTDPNQKNQDSPILHVVDQENQSDANRDPDKSSHQSFFLGEGAVTVQTLSQTVDAFDIKTKSYKKIGSYKRSANFIQGYSLGMLTVGKKTIQVLEDNAATRIPIKAILESKTSKKPAAYIKNEKYNKMVSKSPAIINLYEYKP